MQIINLIFVLKQGINSIIYFTVKVVIAKGGNGCFAKNREEDAK